MPTMPEYRQCSCTRSLIIVREYGNVSMLPSEEINNSLFQIGEYSDRLSLQVFSLETNMAFDLEWLQKNQRTAKTNLERKLFKQNIYIEYLPDVIVATVTPPCLSLSQAHTEDPSYLLPSLLEGN